MAAKTYPARTRTLTFSPNNAADIKHLKSAATNSLSRSSMNVVDSTH
jgi:hypothetical protein